MDAYGTLINAAGGTVTGGSGGAVSTGSSSAAVVNAGTINGNVTVANSFNFTKNTYFALPGGTLNGNLSVGAYDVLVTNLANTGPGQFAGITGTVTAAPTATLRYQVSSDGSGTIGAVGPFTSVGYQLSDNAKLTLTAPAPQTSTLLLAGTGTVNLSAAFNVTDASALQSTSVLSYPGAPSSSTALTITSSGAVTASRSANGSYFGGVINLEGSDTFTNAGTIRLTDHTTSPVAAIYGGANVTNAGTIALDGGIGISGATSVTNTGSIAQVAGGAAAQGVIASTLTNSGTISVGGVAVQLTYASGTSVLTNSGSIASTGGTAITSSAYNGTITNQVGGTITGVGQALRASGASLTNAGTIIGTVDLGYGGSNYRSYNSSIYAAAGGTIAGDLLFGSGNDLLLQSGSSLGVSGKIDGGAGTNIFGVSLSATGTAAIDPAGLTNFQDALIQAVGTGTVATASATATFGGNLYATGNGSIVNQAALAGTLYLGSPSLPYAFSSFFPAAQNMPASVTNNAAIGGVSGMATAFTNTGSVTLLANAGRSAVQITNAAPLTFANSGTVSSNGGLFTYGYGAGVFYNYYVTPTVSLSAQDGLAVANSGTIGSSGLYASVGLTGAGGPAVVTFANSGTIQTVSGYVGAQLEVAGSATDVGGTASITNTGTISAQGVAAGSSQGTTYAASSADGMLVNIQGTTGTFSYTIANTGTIAATGTSPTQAVIGLYVGGDTHVSGAITNGAGGSITATGPNAYGILVADHALNLTNAGAITATSTGSNRPIAIETFDSFNNTVRNTGTITGDVVLAAGSDVVDNAGTITGNVSLGDGNDTFIQRAGSTVTGLVDGGAGINTYLVNTTGGGTVLAASGIANFASLTQTGTGTGVYSGVFGTPTINLAGGTLSVASGQTLSTAGGTTLTGTAGAGPLAVINAGTIAGGITLADGDDTVVNLGAIRGPVQLGAGNDTYVEGVGSTAGVVDGGTGTNLYRVELAGNRTGIGARVNFQNLAVDGTGVLSLVLDQNFSTVALNGTGLTLTSGSYSIGQIIATGATGVQVSLDRDIGSVQLGGGSDTLSTSVTTLAGSYDGGAGSNALRLTAAAPVTLAGTVTNFQTISVGGGSLTITGTLGTVGAALAFAGGESVTVGSGGTLAGIVDLGAGPNSFRLAAGGMLAGTVSGGGGAATLDLSMGDLTLRSGVLTNFATLTTQGAGTLTLSGGAFAFGGLKISGNLAVGADAGLLSNINFGAADNRLVIAGQFAGSVDGGAGNNSIDVSGGSAAGPVAFTSIGNIAAYRESAGLSTISGTATLGSIALTGGGLIGLAGSTITAPTIMVGQGSVFGSAGTVNGNIQVAGVLSHGAAPGRMTVNGNVSLASTALFQIMPAASHELAVNGAMSIANGATLQIVPSQAVTPGSSFTLVTASGGITGAFTTIIKPASLFGYVAEDATSIRLLALLRNDPSFSPQVGRAVDYVNSVLSSGQSTPALLAAVPTLAANGVTDPLAISHLPPEPYADAEQVSVDNALALMDTARGPAFAPSRDGSGVYTFASTLGGTRTLEADEAHGTAQATNNEYGFLGGIGYAGPGWSIGAFGGWLRDTQSLSGLGARTTANGAVAGVHARIDSDGFGLRGTVAYDGATAATRRFVPGGSAYGDYGLTGWSADGEVSYTLPSGDGWSIRPAVGATAVRTTRDGTVESGGSPYALTVAGERETAVFVDGGATFARASGAVRPYLTLGARYQVQGRTPYALAGLGGGGIGLLAEGAARAPVLATATLGADAPLSARLSLFGALTGESGASDHRAAAHAGVRLVF